jgi:hypothetical protein
MSNESKLNNNLKQLSQKLGKVLKPLSILQKPFIFMVLLNLILSLGKKQSKYTKINGALTTAEQKEEKNDQGDGGEEEKADTKVQNREKKKKKKKKRTRDRRTKEDDKKKKKMSAMRGERGRKKK